MHLIRLAAIVFCLICGNSAYPDGPPESACVDMMPGVTTGVVGLIGHPAQPQNVLPTYGNIKASPYYITIHRASSQYSPGDEILVSVRANQTMGLAMYKGLFLQARRVVCASDIGKDNETILVEDDPIGTFATIASDMLLQTMECGGIPHSAVCHRSPQYKINETVTWVAPSSSSGHLLFRATIVQEEYIYWTSRHSVILLDSSEADPPSTCSSCIIHGYKPLIYLLLSLVYIHMCSP